MRQLWVEKGAWGVRFGHERKPAGYNNIKTVRVLPPGLGRNRSYFYDLGATPNRFGEVYGRTLSRLR